MPLILRPGQLSRRADFYHQLGQLTGAGLGLVQALEELRRNPPDRSYRQPIARVLDEIANGCTLADALQYVEWLPAFDCVLLQAGEHSGRLEASLRLLADYYRDRAGLARRMIGDLAYPAFLFHFAIFIFPFPNLFLTGNWQAYLGQTLGVLLPLYALVGLMIYAAQSGHGEAWRAWMETILRRIPVLGTGRHYLALSRLAGALGGRRPNAGRGRQRIAEVPQAVCQPVCHRRNQRTARRDVAAVARLLRGRGVAEASCRGPVDPPRHLLLHRAADRLPDSELLPRLLWPDSRGHRMMKRLRTRQMRPAGLKTGLAE